MVVLPRHTKKANRPKVLPPQNPGHYLGIRNQARKLRLSRREYDQAIQRQKPIVNSNSTNASPEEDAREQLAQEVIAAREGGTSLDYFNKYNLYIAKYGDREDLYDGHIYTSGKMAASETPEMQERAIVRWRKQQQRLAISRQGRESHAIRFLEKARAGSMIIPGSNILYAKHRKLELLEAEYPKISNILQQRHGENYRIKAESEWCTYFHRIIDYALIVEKRRNEESELPDERDSINLDGKLLF